MDEQDGDHSAALGQLDAAAVTRWDSLQLHQWRGTAQVSLGVADYRDVASLEEGVVSSCATISAVRRNELAASIQVRIRLVAPTRELAYAVGEDSVRSWLTSGAAGLRDEMGNMLPVQITRLVRAG